MLSKETLQRAEKLRNPVEKSTMNPTPEENKKYSPTLEYIQRMERLHKQIEMKISDITQKLSPVLTGSDETPSPLVPEAGPEPDTELADMLYRRYCGLAYLLEILDILRQRISL